tara:strand:+ start:139 stop:528 length:390 start_codon:yes stop_codon:yes gene_type:complete
MEDLFLTATATSPFVHFKKTGEIELSGKMILDGNAEFWMQVTDWIKIYKQQPASTTLLNIQIDYLNASSLKRLNKFLAIISEINSPENKLCIVWNYNDSDIYMKEIGFELANQSGLSFQMKLIEEFVLT